MVETAHNNPRWTPLEAIERRVLGVLVEKAKCTPSAYPLTLNAIRVGANQVTNRFPQMSLEEPGIEDAIDSLRQKGAVSVIQGDGRVEKYRHLAYEWLGVDKVEMAVMAELLLRGAQTVGELRTRASRMEPIKSLGELEQVVRALAERKLVLYLSPPGRGAVVTHNLYQQRELDKVRREVGVTVVATNDPDDADEADVPTPPPAPPPTASPAAMEPRPIAPAATPAGPSLATIEAAFREQLDEVRQQVTELSSEIERLRGELHDLKMQLGA